MNLIHDILEILVKIGKETFYFLAVYVFLRHIVAKKVADYFEKKLDEHPIRYGRFLAIWRHHIEGAKHGGHSRTKILDCTNKSCLAL